MVVLHDTQRGMEHQPVQQVGELAQSAADALRRLPTLDHEPFAVAPSAPEVAPTSRQNEKTSPGLMSTPDTFGAAKPAN